MLLLGIVKENPVTVLGVALLALLGWVAVDFATVPVPRSKEEPEPQPYLEEIPLPDPPKAVAIEEFRERILRESPPGSVGVSSVSLPLLKPGMKRVEVEFFLGPPTPDRIQPVTIHEGRMTYATAYELDDMGPPKTIRPIRPYPRTPTQPDSPRTLITLVFDAAEPGHPLIDILYPDPLF